MKRKGLGNRDVSRVVVLDLGRLGGILKSRTLREDFLNVQP
jgi:hypothetical protein